MHDELTRLVEESRKCSDRRRLSNRLFAILSGGFQIETLPKFPDWSANFQGIIGPANVMT